ncbi:hypothetical protein, partial [Mesorhizobium sp.]|uniref:hypothetical protein n=1 Tax=Mesorhizobium sp. TaxID=1871066 RepID=UPI0025BF5A53
MVDSARHQSHAKHSPLQTPRGGARGFLTRSSFQDRLNHDQTEYGIKFRFFLALFVHAGTLAQSLFVLGMEESHGERDASDRLLLCNANLA